MKAVITIKFADDVEKERARLTVYELLGSLVYRPFMPSVELFVQSTHVEWQE